MLIPRRGVESPAIIVELKFREDADTAISQIKKKQYPEKVAQHADNIILVGISYNKKQKTHSCVIERP